MACKLFSRLFKRKPRSIPREDANAPAGFTNPNAITDPIGSHIKTDFHSSRYIQPSADATSPGARKNAYDGADDDSSTKCQICACAKLAVEFPQNPPTGSCDHDCATCSDCLERWITSQLAEASASSVFRCLECGSRLDHANIKGVAPAAVFERYDRMLLHSQLSSSPDFRWCLAPGCGAGQIHPEPDHDPIFTCQNCGHRSCALCDVPWHEGQSCASHRRHRKNEQQSNDTVFNTTKACPQCRSRIEKNDGCDHMTCFRCRYEFCWACLADYKRVVSVGNAAHEDTCRYHSSRL